jgi:4,5-DOPA dioxygenase extradiol
VQALAAPTAVATDHEWGLDHGTWSVLVHIYPDASVPVVQLSIDHALSPQAHYEIGRRLAPLRDEGVLIFGSGNVVHNLRTAKWGEDSTAYPWAESFEQDIKAVVIEGRHDAVINPAQFGEAAALSIPTAEHYLPLLYVLGSSVDEDTVSFPTDGIELGSVSMLTVLLQGWTNLWYETSDRTPCHDARAPRKKRGFSSELATTAAGYIPVPGWHLGGPVSYLGGGRRPMEN